MMPARALPTDLRSLLARPALRRQIADVVRAKAPPDAVEDLVQATLVEALAAASPPEEPEALRRWVLGIARHLVADHHRARRGEDRVSVSELSTPAPSHGARDLERWVEGVVPAGEEHARTVEWMMREGDGEKLEHIAAAERVPAPRVRQRVFRLRKLLRERWREELALVGVIALAWAVWHLTRPAREAAVSPDRGTAPMDEPRERAQPTPSSALAASASAAPPAPSLSAPAPPPRPTAPTPSPSGAFGVPGAFGSSESLGSSPRPQPQPQRRAAPKK